MKPRSIAGVNQLGNSHKEAIYKRFIPQVLLDQFDLSPEFVDDQGRRLLELRCEPGTTDVVIILRHEFGAPDPLLYAHLTDTINMQIHVLLYIVNDPCGERFDVDRMPDGTPTQFGIFKRNIAAEKAAMEAGLAPGQVRRGLRILRHSIESFETFVDSLSHDLFFVEPLYYHNAVIFERYGFAYLRGRKLMEHIDFEFREDGVYARALDASTPFRRPQMATSIRGRSWAIHDGLMGQAFDKVTMYKSLGRQAGISTFPAAVW
jgi:hypothetical protein